MKIGVMGDYIGMTTGYGQDSLGLLNGLKELGHEVYNYALQYTGFPANINGINVYSARTTEDLDRSLANSKPDILVHYRDNWVYTSFSSAGQYHIKKLVNKHGTKLVNWTPIQAIPMPEEYEKSFFDDGDYTLVTTNWAGDYVKSLGVDNVSTLYVGVDPQFRHIEQDKRPFDLPQDGTMLMNVGMAGDWRKMTPVHQLVLKEYLKYDPDAFLYLHTLVRSFYGNDLCQRFLGLPKEKVIYSPFQDAGGHLHAFSVPEFNELYHAADAYMNFSTSEGFGKTELEAAILGIPTFVTDFPVHRELLSEFSNVHFVKSRQDYPTVWGFEWMVDVESAVDMLQGCSHIGFPKEDYYLPDRFRWSSIAKRAEKIFNSL